MELEDLQQFIDQCKSQNHDKLCEIQKFFYKMIKGTEKEHAADKFNDNELSEIEEYKDLLIKQSPDLFKLLSMERVDQISDSLQKLMKKINELRNSEAGEVLKYLVKMVIAIFLMQKFTEIMIKKQKIWVSIY